MNLSREQFRELLIEALEDPALARLAARKLLLPATPIQGGACATTAATIGSGDFGSNCNPADTGNYTFAGGGTVGIGTASPATSYAVHVAGKGAYIPGATGTNNLVVGAGSTATIAAVAYSTYWAKFGYDYAGTQTGFIDAVTGGSAAGFAFRTGGTERMRLNAAGNLGIGATNRLSLLTVKGRSFSAAGMVSTDGTSTVAGTNTKFTVEVGIGDRVTISGQTQTVISIASDVQLVVDSPFASGGGPTMTVLKSLLRADDSSGSTKFLVSDQGSVVIGGTAAKQDPNHGGPELISFRHTAFNHVAFACFVGSETEFRFGASLHGFMEWGPGNADQDVALFRYGPGGLAVQSFNAMDSDHVFSVQRPTSSPNGAAPVGPDLFHVSSLGGVSESSGDVGIKTHEQTTGAAWSASDAFTATAAVKTTDATTTTLASLTLDDNRAYYITARVVARQGDATSSTHRAFYWRAALAFRQGGNATIQGSVLNLGTVESDPNWDCTIDTAGSDVRVRVTGASTADAFWVAEIEYQSVSTDS